MNFGKKIGAKVKLMLARRLVALIITALVSFGVIGAETAGIIDLVADAGLGTAGDVSAEGIQPPD